MEIFGGVILEALFKRISTFYAKFCHFENESEGWPVRSEAFEANNATINLFF